MDKFLAFWLCVLSLSGCHGATATISGDTPDWTFQTPSQLRERMSDAGQIVNFKTRDQAMARIALDAAGSDVPEVAFTAIESITEYPVRDQSATDCARVFDDRGDRTSAEKAAGQVTDFASRDRIQSYLAQRPPRSWNLGPTTKS